MINFTENKKSTLPSGKVLSFLRLMSIFFKPQDIYDCILKNF